MILEDRFYTSTEVAEVLGVSLRSVYRYLDEGKLDAEIKTATGRHRFTKKNIEDFLYPSSQNANVPVQNSQAREETPIRRTEVVEEAPVHKPAAVLTQEKTLEDSVEEAPVDWLAKFREAAAKFKEDTASESPTVSPVQEAFEYPIEDELKTEMKYYRSMLGGLKDIAQNIDKSARNSNLEYAFTLNAGLSLHKPIKPFATLHAYVRTSDVSFYEKILRLTPSDKDNAQLALITSTAESVFSEREEMHGLYVVSKIQLESDIKEFGDSSIREEYESIFA